MSDRNPTVSIGLPVYNGERYLVGTLNQLLGQDYEDFELIIVNNASTDSTDEICREFAQRDRRIRYSINETNIGASPNWNRAFQLARGEYFKWAMHDDECHPSLLRACIETYRNSPPNTALVFPKANVIDGKGKVKFVLEEPVGNSSSHPHKRLETVLSYIVYANALWGLIRSSMLRRARPAGSIEADLVLLVDLSLQGLLVEIPEVLYAVRIHERNATKINHTERALMAWYNPGHADKMILLPHWDRVFHEYFKCIQNAPMSSRDRFLCTLTLVRVGYWRRFMRWSAPLRYHIGLTRTYRPPERIKPSGNRAVGNVNHPGV